MRTEGKVSYLTALSQIFFYDGMISVFPGIMLLVIKKFFKSLNIGTVALN
jgi:hypothetical protein